MAKHTLGPWTHYGESVWSTHESVSGAVTKGSRTNHVCAISRRLKMPDAEKVANARLIAASPDLLEVLERYVQIDFNDDELSHSARAVIAKATGE